MSTNPKEAEPAGRLTPAEVAAMTDEELSAALARLLPGDALAHRPFLPSNPVAVDYVCEHMRERGFQWWMESDPTGWVARLACSPYWGPYWEADYASARGRAIMEAGLLAAQECT